MSKLQDKALAELYLARSEGKTIQTVDTVCKWHDKVEGAFLYYGNRIKPQTVDGAAEEFMANHEDVINLSDLGLAFEYGAQWQKEQDQ